MLEVNGISKWKHTKIHKKLIAKYGNAKLCESSNCDSVSPKRFEWALKRGHQYSTNKEDYLQLCPSCHRKYDFNEDIRAKLSSLKKGQLHNRSKLTNQDVHTIMEMINSGEQNKTIAAKFNVNNSTISDIKRGKRWSSLTEIKYKP